MLSNNSKNKLGICQMCEENDAKYKCPECELCSCSLSCIRKHKIERNCSGIRNRVKLIAKEEMDNLTLLSDYRFLEEIDHKLEDGLRNPLRKCRLKSQEPHSMLPYHLKRLKLEARKRGTVIEFMPKHFSTHQENTTKYLFADKKITWHVKWEFPQADLVFHEKSIDEDTLVLSLLRKYMEPPHRLDDEVSPLSEEELEKLLYYQSASYSRIVVLFKSSLCNFDKKFIKIDLSKSLKVNLANRKVVEYPVFFVVLKDHLSAYLDMNENDSDDEIERVIKSDELQNIDKKMQNGLRIKSSQEKVVGNKANFFETFSDFSDDSE